MSEQSPKEIRESLKLTQMEMAFRAGVSISTIQAFEAGRLNPQPRIARRLEAAYAKEGIPPVTADAQPADARADQAETNREASTAKVA